MTDARAREILYGGDAQSAYFRSDLIIFKNMDLFRSSDLLLLWCVGVTLLQALPFHASFGVNLPLWWFVGQWYDLNLSLIYSQLVLAHRAYVRLGMGFACSK
jgi:hypothetical protein